MGRNRKKHRQQHGCAWHWKQTDCWYYTMPGTKKRMPLFDDSGQRIRGKKNQEAAETALAKAKVSSESGAAGAAGRERSMRPRRVAVYGGMAWSESRRS